MDSLKQSSYSPKEIIVVDNASTDGSQAWIKRHHPDVRLIENEKNHGYAGGCNKGVEAAKGTFLVFLNNDTIQKSDWLEPLVNHLVVHGKTAAVQPKILNYFNQNQFDYAGGAGGWLDLLGFPFARGRVFSHLEKDTKQYNNTRQVFWSSGTAFMTRKKDFLSAGGFDEGFFAHMEEIDLCWRFHLMAKDVWAIPTSVVIHKNGATLPMFSRKKQYLNHRNSLIMMLTNYGIPLTLYLFPIRIALEGIALVYSLIKWDIKHFMGILHANLWIIVHPGYILRRRRNTKKIRLICDKLVIDKMFKGSVVFGFYLGRKQKASEFFPED